jgi:hypothetical protein
MKMTRTSYEVDTTSWPAHGIADLHEYVLAKDVEYGRTTTISSTEAVAAQGTPAPLDETEDETEGPALTQDSYDLLLALIEKKGAHAQAQAIRKVMTTGEPISRAECLALLGKDPEEDLPKFRSHIKAAVKELQGAGFLDESINPLSGVLAVDYGKGVKALGFHLGEALVPLRARLVAEGKL